MEVPVFELNPIPIREKNGQGKNTAKILNNGSARADEPSITAAKWAVAEYLRDLGISDPDLIARESCEIVSQALHSQAIAQKSKMLTEAAIEITVKQLDRWLAAVATHAPESDENQQPIGVLGGRLPELLNRFPQAWKETPPLPELADSLSENLTPVVPEMKPGRMRPQRMVLVPSSFRRLRAKLATLFGRKPLRMDESIAAPRVVLSKRRAARISLAILTFLTTVLGTWLFFFVAASNGIGILGYSLTVLFAILLTWVAFSFWMATMGLMVRLRNGSNPRQPFSEPGHLPPTALVMPVHNENPRRVFANISAIAASLGDTGHESAFNIFVLSDTTNPDIWLEEEREWAKLVAKLPAHSRVFYRHRAKNNGRKAGNIADFCRRWGNHYRYMVVLDADSLISGETLVELVRRMEADPEIGILQTPSRPINRQSFFARMQQFAAHLYGPTFLEGFVYWSECDGNYWGHNAIIRMRPFMEHCELPTLPGHAPLGGEILSHDFVEAALMRRAGWKICMAHDLESYEECPSTILGFAQRDQRWCQGNLQHLRLILAEGLHPASRLHFGMGAMSFLASPLWFAFLILTLVAAIYGGNLPAGDFHSRNGLTLFAITMSLLLLPKLWSVIVTRRSDRPSHSGAASVGLSSVLIETFVSMLVAPIMMLLHTRFVLSTLLGKKVSWDAQDREDGGVSFAEAFRVHFGHTMAGLILSAIAWIWTPDLFPWLLPVLVGLVFSIPLAVLLGSRKVGTFLAQERLLTIPEELNPPKVVRFQQEALAVPKPLNRTIADLSNIFSSFLQDPAFYALHVGILRATETQLALSSDEVRKIIQLVNIGHEESISADLRRVILLDPLTLEALHIRARSHIPAAQSVLLA
jgi:membrane glycosyltransferase